MNIFRIENLPHEILGNILTQLNIITDSSENSAVNSCAILRNATYLSITCKKIYQGINDPDVTALFLSSLAYKYGGTSIRFAKKLDSIGSRVWLWNHIQNNEYDKVYKVIGYINDMITKVKEEIKVTELDFNSFESELRTDPYYCQTKNGLFLTINYTSGCYLATPLGGIRIFKILTGSYSGCSPWSVAERFIQILGASFEKIVCKNIQHETIYEIVPPADIKKIRKLSIKDIKEVSNNEVIDKQGSKSLIFSREYSSIYKLEQVKEIHLPTAKWREESEPGYDYEDSKILGKILKRHYAEQEELLNI